MTEHPAFSLISARELPELSSEVRHYRHDRTGAELVSMINQDENKVFGITFKTPPADSTGIAHILEHSVLCGSERFPLRKPFVEMARGSLQTFLNAMTFPDKTAYPLASQNLQDFYNLIDVYLDAVLNPILSEDTFRQEGWHFEADTPEAPLTYKGVVFNEMKGAYSAPDTVFSEVMRQSLMPDTIYALSSGGDPRVMPDLTFEQFKAFHQAYYHPSNARVMFYGDDDPAARLDLIDKAFARFEAAEPAGDIALQPKFTTPVSAEGTYAARPEQGPARDGMFSITWMLDPPEDHEAELALSVLGHVLVGTAASPLKRKLTESGLGESVRGGLSAFAQQPTMSFGLKGIDPANRDKIEELILTELKHIADTGVPAAAVEAAINTTEFQLRELNTGNLPRGIALMFGALGQWLHGHDPIDALAFAKPLADLKQHIADDADYFVRLIRTQLLDNPHRSSVLLKADPDLAAKEAREERARLDAARDAMSDTDITNAIEVTRKLRTLQATPDAPEAVATLPRLGIEDLPRENIEIPVSHLTTAGVETLFHEQPANGIIYLDLAFNLRALDQKHLPFLPLFDRALTQTGTDTQDFAEFIQRIGRTTGGVGASRLISAIDGEAEALAYVALRGKATADHTQDLLDLMGDVMSRAKLVDKERLRQMIREAKAGIETRLAPAGHQLAGTRLGAGLSEAGWLGEEMSGISQLFFLRDLEKRLDEDWEEISATLIDMRDRLFGRRNLIVNVTATEADWYPFHAPLGSLLESLPDGREPDASWTAPSRPVNEGLSFSAQVNYVAKGFNLHDHGYTRSGAASVALQHLNMSYLWDKVRVEGGAYGGFSSYNHLSGNFQFGSYRDPNLLKTLDVYDAAGDFLRKPVPDTELIRSIIGVIGQMDRYQLPDAKGFSSFSRHLIGETAEKRQERRLEVLNASPADFAALGDALDAARNDARIVVLGSEENLEAANAERGDFLTISKVL